MVSQVLSLEQRSKYRSPSLAAGDLHVSIIMDNDSRPTVSHDQRDSDVKRHVCIFWDIENVRVPSGWNAKAVAMELRNKFVTNGYVEYDFYAACDCTRESKLLLTALNDAEISVLHTDAFRKNSADSKLRSVMRRTAAKMKPHDKIVLVSSDSDFAPEVREIRYTHLISMVLVHNPVVSGALLNFAHEHYAMLDLLSPPAAGSVNTNSTEMSDDVANKTLILKNLPPRSDGASESRLNIDVSKLGGRIDYRQDSCAYVRFSTSDTCWRAKTRFANYFVGGRQVEANFVRSSQLHRESVAADKVRLCAGRRLDSVPTSNSNSSENSSAELARRRSRSIAREHPSIILQSNEAVTHRNTVDELAMLQRRPPSIDLFFDQPGIALPGRLERTVKFDGQQPGMYGVRQQTSISSAKADMKFAGGDALSHVEAATSSFSSEDAKAYSEASPTSAGVMIRMPAVVLPASLKRVEKLSVSHSLAVGQPWVSASANTDAAAGDTTNANDAKSAFAGSAGLSFFRNLFVGSSSKRTDSLPTFPVAEQRDFVTEISNAALSNSSQLRAPLSLMPVHAIPFAEVPTSLSFVQQNERINSGGSTVSNSSFASASSGNCCESCGKPPLYQITISHLDPSAAPAELECLIRLSIEKQVAANSIESISVVVNDVRGIGELVGNVLLKSAEDAIAAMAELQQPPNSFKVQMNRVRCACSKKDALAAALNPKQQNNSASAFRVFTATASADDKVLDCAKRIRKSKSRKAQAKLDAENAVDCAPDVKACALDTIELPAHCGVLAAAPHRLLATLHREFQTAVTASGDAMFSGSGEKGSASTNVKDHSYVLSNPEEKLMLNLMREKYGVLLSMKQLQNYTRSISLKSPLTDRTILSEVQCALHTYTIGGEKEHRWLVPLFAGADLLSIGEMHDELVIICRQHAENNAPLACSRPVPLATITVCYTMIRKRVFPGTLGYKQFQDLQSGLSTSLTSDCAVPIEQLLAGVCSPKVQKYFVDPVPEKLRFIGMHPRQLAFCSDEDAREMSDPLSVSSCCGGTVAESDLNLRDYAEKYAELFAPISQGIVSLLMERAEKAIFCGKLFDEPSLSAEALNISRRACMSFMNLVAVYPKANDGRDLFTILWEQGRKTPLARYFPVQPQSLSAAHDGAVAPKLREAAFTIKCHLLKFLIYSGCMPDLLLLNGGRTHQGDDLQHVFVTLAPHKQLERFQHYMNRIFHYSSVDLNLRSNGKRKLTYVELSDIRQLNSDSTQSGAIVLQPFVYGMSSLNDMIRWLFIHDDKFSFSREVVADGQTVVKIGYEERREKVNSGLDNEKKPAVAVPEPNRKRGRRANPSASEQSHVSVVTDKEIATSDVDLIVTASVALVSVAAASTRMPINQSTNKLVEEVGAPTAQGLSVTTAVSAANTSLPDPEKKISKVEPVKLVIRAKQSRSTDIAVEKQQPPAALSKCANDHGPVESATLESQPSSSKILLPTISVDKLAVAPGLTISSSEQSSANAPAVPNERFPFIPVSVEDRAQSLPHKQIAEVVSVLIELVQVAVAQHQSLPRDYRQLIKLYKTAVEGTVAGADASVTAAAKSNAGLTAYDRQRALARLGKSGLLQFDYPPNQYFVGLPPTTLARVSELAQQISRAKLTSMALCKQRKHYLAACANLVSTYEDYVESLLQQRPGSGLVEEEMLPDLKTLKDRMPTATVFMYFSQLYVHYVRKAKTLTPPIPALVEVSAATFAEMLSKEFADLIEIRYRADDARLAFNIKAVMAFNTRTDLKAKDPFEPSPSKVLLTAASNGRKNKNISIHSPPSMSGVRPSSSKLQQVSSSNSTGDLLTKAARRLAAASASAAPQQPAMGNLVGLPQPVRTMPRLPPPVVRNVNKPDLLKTASNSNSNGLQSVLYDDAQLSKPTEEGVDIFEPEAYKLLPYPLLKDFKLRLCTNLANRPAKSITLWLFHKQFISLPRRVQLFRIHKVETIGRVILRQCSDAVIIEHHQGQPVTYYLQPNWKNVAYSVADEWECSMALDWEWARRLQQRVFVKLYPQPKRRMLLSAMLEYFAADARRSAENPIKNLLDLKVILTRYFTDTVLLSRPKTTDDDESTAVVLLNEARQWPTFNPFENANSCRRNWQSVSPSTSGSSFRTPSLVLSTSSSMSQDMAIAASLSPPPVAVGSSRSSLSDQDLLRSLQEQQLNRSVWKMENQQPFPAARFDDIQTQQSRHISASSSTATCVPQSKPLPQLTTQPASKSDVAQLPNKPVSKSPQWWHSRLSDKDSDFYRRLQQRIYTFVFNQNKIQRCRVTLGYLYAMWCSKAERLAECPFLNAVHMQSILEKYFADSFVFKRVVDAGSRGAGGNFLDNVVVEIIPSARQQQASKRYHLYDGSSSAQSGNNTPHLNEGAVEQQRATLKTFAQRAYASRVFHASRNAVPPTVETCALQPTAFDEKVLSSSSSLLSFEDAAEGSKKHWESAFFDVQDFASTSQEEDETAVANSTDDSEISRRNPTRGHGGRRRVVSGNADEELFNTSSAPLSSLRQPLPLVCPTRGPLLDFSDGVTDNDGDAFVSANTTSSDNMFTATAPPEDASLERFEANHENLADDEANWSGGCSLANPTNQSRVSIDLEQELAERFASIMRDVDC